jgi:hypothetical protein
MATTRPVPYVEYATMALVVLCVDPVLQITPLAALPEVKVIEVPLLNFTPVTAPCEPPVIGLARDVLL